MKIKLFDFQIDALHELRQSLLEARPFASSDKPRAIAFSAPTGSGKTIIMTALFEAILTEPDEELAWPLDWQAQADAVILWVSDMPELNEQTRLKIESQSDRIYRVDQLIPIDASLDVERLQGGRVYFINTQKLGNDKLLTKVGDSRKYSIWSTLTNTAKALPDRFYVVIDEAHRGMLAGRGATEAQTLMQRFLLGYPEVGLVKMPLVIGISATPKRFMDLLEHAPHTVHKVAIEADKVRQSGLLKERVLIHHPETETTADMSLLEEAARVWSRLSAGWKAYCKIEHEKTVWPILIVQVENGTDTLATKTNLAVALDTIEKAIGRSLQEGEVVHTLNDQGDIDIVGRRLRKIEASRIESDKNICVVVFKTNLSTGWDCPRAEVMMSFRRVEDHTYIAQLLGRMVRTPLARRIERDAALNDVHLFLPYFNAEAVQAVIDDLQTLEDIPPTETGSSRKLVVLKRREGTEPIFQALDNLVTYRVNAARSQSGLRRYMAISRNLTMDNIDLEAWDGAKKTIVDWMGLHIADIKAKEQFDPAEKTITQIGMKTIAVNQVIGSAESAADYQIESAEVDIDRQFAEAGRLLSHGLHQVYWKQQGDRDSVEVKVEVIILKRNHAAMSALEAAAEKAFGDLYDLHKGQIGKLKEQRRKAYEKLRLATAKPQEVPWHLPESIDFRRSPSAPLWERHVYVEENDQFRAELGSWEAAVLAEELVKSNVVGWLRNMDRKPWSLEIPYDTGGDIRPMFPDLVIVRQQGEGFIIDILEPHDSSLADNYEKAKGLARFAEQHGHLFGRIQLIRQQSSPVGGGYFARLDINQEVIIKKLKLISDNSQLDELFADYAK
ncbi:MAG: type III deoxyribonuclease [Candidatus Methylumidiphilus alinenensis]|uniref:Type III deoxyribonuclease n=1 Tax=Candidatus Methylumidiphilus alinenensis TaxID=2202197 RepID=A0A2W4QYG4_9GAMM|nr:MAG: type III deoxyribonuclease [Candidatus Methylumidiphilus alinenensis]